jgi:alkanesulfonate monooxygenase SsuD/methylene tetrahydromethanopterin reductase-like flavin-dependent oxidoreductase (luciferase family)
VSDDRDELERIRARAVAMPVVVGTPDEVADHLAAYAAAGVDEFIVSERCLPADDAARLDAMDRILEVARAVV